MSQLELLKNELCTLGSVKKARNLSWFFKTGKGEYGEGDTFLGVTVPEQRKVARRFKELSLPLLSNLLRSREHEFRLTALLILVHQFEQGDKKIRRDIFAFYTKHAHRINNWDLVDLSAPNIFGTYLLSRNSKQLTCFAKSRSLWKRRIAMISTFAFIKNNRPEIALTIAKLLLHDKHDLIHKAVGWMLREVGKRCGLEEEIKFLDLYARTMPRTMLRYAIERFPSKLRKHYLNLS